MVGIGLGRIGPSAAAAAAALVVGSGLRFGVRNDVLDLALQLHALRVKENRAIDRFGEGKGGSISIPRADMLIYGFGIGINRSFASTPPALYLSFSFFIAYNQLDVNM